MTAETGREALFDLERGSFDGLVRHLRSGAPIDGELAALLVEILDPAGDADWKVKIQGRAKNKRTVRRAETDNWKRLEVGAWAHVWIEGHDRGSAQLVRHMMAERFEVGETFVREALAYFRKVKRIWEGDSADYAVIRGAMDIVFAKEAERQAEQALAAAEAGLSED